MTQKEILIDLLENEFIPELEEYMDELFALIADKKSTDETVAELEETRELYKEFQELLEDARADEMDEEECREVIEELQSIFEEGEEL